MPVSAGAHETPEPRPAALLGAALGSALLFSSMAVPVLGPFAAIVSPLPLIVQRLRSGLGGALLAFLLAAALVAGVFSAGHGVQFVVLAVPVLLIGECLARGRGLVRGCAWAFTLLAVEIGVALLFAGPKLVAPLLEEVAHYRSPEFLEEMRSTGLPPETIEQWAEQSASFQQIFEVVYPAAFIIAGALVVLANASLLRAYLARRDPGWLEGGEFETIRWPFLIAVLFVLGGASVTVPALRTGGYNLLLIVAFFFALQGLAVVAFYARRLAGPPFLRVAVTVLVLVNPWAPQILALLGLFDTWFDFRKWAEPPQPEKRG
jgi:uncharacterized protein YybS (DUF2232 family)